MSISVDTKYKYLIYLQKEPNMIVIITDSKLAYDVQEKPFWEKSAEVRAKGYFKYSLSILIILWISILDNSTRKRYKSVL